MTTLPIEVAPAVTKDAALSDDGLYRYLLTRQWDPNVAPAVFIMLNPSTADAELDDPTIRRCMGFARSWGLGGILVANLYAYRATDPKTLWTVDDPVGPDNDEAIAGATILAKANNAPIVAAWGANARPARVEAVAALVGSVTRLHALGTTKDGHPRHPLYVRGDTQLVRWDSPLSDLDVVEAATTPRRIGAGPVLEAQGEGPDRD